MMRAPIGSLPASAPSTTRNMPPCGLVFGTVSASTTLIHGVAGIAAKYLAAADLLVRHLLREMLHQAGVGLARIRCLARAVLEVLQGQLDVVVSQAGDGGVLRPALAVRIMAEAA